jgi:hypothetical protein
MDDRRLIDVTVYCRGIPVGTAPLLLRTETSGRQALRIGPGTPLPAYEGLIGQALRAYKEAKTLWACLPYPEAASAQAEMTNAWNALSAVWSALELRDETGAVLPIPVERFSERVVSAKLSELPASVVAGLREKYWVGQ